MPRGPVSRGDQSQRRQEDRRAVLRRKDPTRSLKRWEPAELLRPPTVNETVLLRIHHSIAFCKWTSFMFFNDVNMKICFCRKAAKKSRRKKY